MPSSYVYNTRTIEREIFPGALFEKKIDFSPKGKVVAIEILVSCIESFFDSILLFYAKFDRSHYMVLYRNKVFIF